MEQRGIECLAELFKVFLIGNVLKYIIFFLLYIENNRQHKSPLILDCGHTFCEGCLTKLARDTKTCIACPTCQVSVDRAI